MVKSIENDFIPLLVRNNKPGAEAQLLKKYKEPSWNYPVVRFVDGKGKDLIPRKDQLFRKEQILARMNEVLAKTKRTTEVDATAKPKAVATKTVALSQYCFWTGELAIGGIEGVRSTEAGFLKGKEVTLVKYDPATVTQDQLVKQAKAQSCANDVYSGNDLKGYRTARESDQKRQLQGTRFAKIKGLTPYQKTKLNAFARTDPARAKTYLTPEQKAQL